MENQELRNSQYSECFPAISGLSQKNPLFKCFLGIFISKLATPKDFQSFERFSPIKQIVENNGNLWKNQWFLWKSSFLRPEKCWDVVQNSKQQISSVPGNLGMPDFYWISVICGHP